MTYVDSALLDLTELCCRRFQLLTGRTNIWLAIQLTNLSIIVYFVWAALVFSISDVQVRIVLGVFCTAVLYALTETVFKVSRDALLRISFLTLSIFLAYPVVFLYRQYHVGIALLTYCLIVLTTVVLYLLACDPLPPCPGKAWEWLKGLARPRRSVTDVRGAGLRRAIVSALAAAAGWMCVAAAAQPPAAIGIDAGTVQGRLSPLLYGQFIEFMFAGIKRGLHAELLRNRSFEEAGDATGLSRYWERYPDSRNDDYAITFSRGARRPLLRHGRAARHLSGAGAGETGPRVPRIRVDPHQFMDRKRERRPRGGWERRTRLRRSGDRRCPRRSSKSGVGRMEEVRVRAQAGGRRSPGAVRAAVHRVGHGLGRSRFADAGRCPRRRPRRRDGHDRGAGASLHPLAGRQRRAGLSLAVGHRSARRAAAVDQSRLEERDRTR